MKSPTPPVSAFLGPPGLVLASLFILFLTASAVLSLWHLSEDSRPRDGAEVKSAAGPGERCRWQKYANFPDYDSLYPNESPPAPVKKLFYSKVFKTGSTTVSSLLNKFTEDHNLTVFKPAGATVQGPGAVRQRLRSQHIAAFDAILHHAQYTEQLLEEFLTTRSSDGSKVTPFKVTSVRHPRERLLSSFYFAHERARAGVEPSRVVCYDLLDDYNAWIQQCRYAPQYMYISPSNWPMTRRRNVNLLVSHYDHFFVTEQMSRSILTLAPKMRLTFREMVVVPQKTTFRKSQSSAILAEAEAKDLVVSADAVVETEASLKLDLELYRRVEARLENEFDALPQELKRAEADLATVTNEVTEVCNGPDREDTSWTAFEKCIESWFAKNVFC